MKSFPEIRQSLLDMGASLNETKTIDDCELWAVRNIKSTGELIDFLEEVKQHRTMKDWSFYIAISLISLIIAFALFCHTLNNLPIN